MSLTILNSDVLSPAQVGGKAANISKMLNMGLRVPLGFVAGTKYTFERDFTTGEKYETDSELAYSLNSYIRWLAQQTDTTWANDHGKPLIVSVRSGAPISMPGMMDTILNVGLTKS